MAIVDPSTVPVLREASLLGTVELTAYDRLIH